jgi:hypothetical protein
MEASLWEWAACLVFVLVACGALVQWIREYRQLGRARDALGLDPAQWWPHLMLRVLQDATASERAAIVDGHDRLAWDALVADAPYRAWSHLYRVAYGRDDTTLRALYARLTPEGRAHMSPAEVLMTLDHERWFVQEKTPTTRRKSMRY